MGRLIGYGPGEVADRLSILALKILHGQLTGRDVAHFEAERTAIACLHENPQIVDLAVVNAALWHAEDALRALRPQPEPLPIWDPIREAQEVGFQIQALNDRRSELITLINANAGASTGPEKL